jgi:hypothetical protein
MGKRTSKCSGDARPPLDPSQNREFERAVRRKQTTFPEEIWKRKTGKLAKITYATPPQKKRVFFGNRISFRDIMETLTIVFP